MIIRLLQQLKPYSAYFLAVYTIALVTVSSIPHIPTLKIHTAGTDIRLDYLIHFCEYCILAFLSYLTFSENDFQLNGRKFFIMAAGLILFAILDELHQKLIPGRSYNILDMLSNILGIISALVLTPQVFRVLLRRD